jgi:hypothetical protein
MWCFGVLFVDILLAIKGCEAHRDRYDAIFQTWGCEALAHRLPHKVFVRFYTGLTLDVPDDYKSLPLKTKAICEVGKEFDFTLLVDTDTYLSIPRAIASGFEQHAYSGWVISWLRPYPKKGSNWNEWCFGRSMAEFYVKYPYCSGPSYWLSHKACEIIAEADYSDPRYRQHILVPGQETSEDVMVGAVLAVHGIQPHHDERYVSPVDIAPDNDIISNHLSLDGPYTNEKMYATHKRMNP